MTKLILIRVTTVLSVIFLSGCFTIYKNRDEFSKASGVEKLTFTTPRSLDAVVASLQKQFVACNMSGQTSWKGAGHQQVTLTYTMSIKRVSPIKAELNYQLKTSNAMGEPEGGQWAYVANFNSTGSRGTLATFYHAGVQQADLTNALRKWTEGDVSSCFGVGSK